MKKKFPKQVFVTGIGTGVGKTIVCAILVEALKADYWKPVQAGGLDNSDTNEVQSLVSNPDSTFHPESYRLKLAASPHYAAAQEGLEIDPNNIYIPKTNNYLVIEGAGGIMVPINQKATILDLMLHFNTPVILVSRNYLGSINHTLLSVGMLKNYTQDINLLGIIFNGTNYNDNEEIIVSTSEAKVLGRITDSTIIDASFVKQQAALMRESLSIHFDL